MPRTLLGFLACAATALPAQFNNPGAYTSPVRAGSTDGHNILFFGNSFTISSLNPLVNTPSYGGARGVPELVRQIAIAGGQQAPFVKNVFHTGRGYDHHVCPQHVSLSEIDEQRLDGETWDFVVMQGYSTRPTTHPYTGNRSKLRTNGLKLFDEVRAGSTNHVLQSPGVTPVLYQTWARHPAHWVYDVTSPNRRGNNIPGGARSWTGSALFASAGAMAAQVRIGYAQLKRDIDRAVPGASAKIARAGDAWAAANWGVGGLSLYATDFFHANSHGDLLSALTIYGTIYNITNTSAIISGGGLNQVLAAIGVTQADGAVVAGFADQVLNNPPRAVEPTRPPLALLVDFSNAEGTVAGVEVLPVPGRHYNTITDLAAGSVTHAIDTMGQRTPISVVITDGFAGETASGSEGAWNKGVGLSGSIYDRNAQKDSFFVGTGFGYSDGTATIEVRGLSAARLYDFSFHGSWTPTGARTEATALAHFRIASRRVTMNAHENLNIVATLSGVAADPRGVVTIEVTGGGMAGNFAHLGVLEIRATRRIVRDD